MNPSVGYAVQVQTLKEKLHQEPLGFLVYTWINASPQGLWSRLGLTVYMIRVIKKEVVKGKFIKVHGSMAWIFLLLMFFHFHLGNYMWQLTTLQVIGAFWKMCMITYGIQALTCLCCWSWASSVWTLSTSKMTGNASMTNDVLKIQTVFPETL